MITYLESPIGVLKITEEDNHIVSIEFHKGKKGKTDSSKLLEKTCRQLNEYFSGKRKKFDLPLKLDGTEFQVKVWKALLKVGYGNTCSYKDLAVAIKNPKAVRAVGGANNKNRIPIVVPCHRVVGKNGDLTGYAGGLEKKSFLLKLEEDS